MQGGDGRRETGRAMANHVLTLDVAAGETGTLEIIYEMEPETQNAQEIHRWENHFGRLPLF